eukprot:TRINITY_DN14229_c0_g1_i1.p1 TRINITY_DN14229_c0_g1~~TRINITY_DN14229_c0_g1_i1.p1  ORF type:complete len:255 (+),score=77.02 TRINITY_DN14229_c0_g1_i1:32-796(+)
MAAAQAATHQDADWLRQSVGVILQEGLAVVASAQPADPVDYLGKWLKSRVAAQKQRDQTRAELQELVKQREQYAEEQKLVEEERRHQKQIAVLQKQDALRERQEKRAQRQEDRRLKALAGQKEKDVARFTELLAGFEASPDDLGFLTTLGEQPDNVQKVVQAALASADVDPADPASAADAAAFVAALKRYKEDVPPHAGLTVTEIPESLGLPAPVKNLLEWVQLARKFAGAELLKVEEPEAPPPAADEGDGEDD